MVGYRSAEQCLVRKRDDLGVNGLQRADRDEPTVGPSIYLTTISQITALPTPWGHMIGDDCLGDSKSAVEPSIDESFDIESQSGYCKSPSRT